MPPGTRPSPGSPAVGVLQSMALARSGVGSSAGRHDSSRSDRISVPPPKELSYMGLIRRTSGQIILQLREM